jgi:GNAT superfamily N-acetyltransferase
LKIRAAGPGDLPFLRETLARAAGWRYEDVDRRLAEHPGVSRYLDGFGRAGDAAVIAEDEFGRSTGAAWYRYFSADEPGFGFVGPDVPELTIAVSPEARGRGTGTALLTALIDHAVKDGVRALSLSVEEDNPAVRLYRRLGFVPAGAHENAITMRLDLIPPAR